MSFVRVIRREAVEKDRILRGNGVKFPTANDAGHWEGTLDADIASQADALKKALPLPAENFRPTPPLAPQTLRHRVLTLWQDNQLWLGPIAFAAGLIGLYPLNIFTKPALVRLLGKAE